MTVTEAKRRLGMIHERQLRGVSHPSDEKDIDYFCRVIAEGESRSGCGRPDCAGGNFYCPSCGRGAHIR